jgi:hypothetical protein
MISRLECVCTNLGHAVLNFSNRTFEELRMVFNTVRFGGLEGSDAILARIDALMR